MSIADRIAYYWAAHNQVSHGVFPFKETVYSEEARKLEHTLSIRFGPHVERWAEGLITCAELIALLECEGRKPCH